MASGDVNRHVATDIAADKSSRAASNIAAASNVGRQASWAQYVQNLVREQIAEIHDGVIARLREGINEQGHRLRRERDSNSAKVERALADIRAAKAEMREEIRAEPRTLHYWGVQDQL
jgi:hypothetical protein